MAHWMAGMAHFFMQYGTYGLFILSFAEASFFPVPPYLLSIPMTLSNPHLAFFYAMVGTIGSVLGGLFGYVLGVKLGRPVLAKIMKPATLNRFETFYSRYGDWATAAGGITPLPYKIFAIAAGVFRTRLATFIPSSIFARGIRFFGEAFLIILYGRKVMGFLESAFGPINLIVLIVGAVVFVLVWHAGWIPEKLIFQFRRLRDCWLNWAGQIKQRFFPAGVFSWYLLTGATLTAFGFIIFTKIASELLEQELTRFDTTIGNWVISYRSGLLTLLMRGFTFLGSTAWIAGVMVFVTVFGLKLRRHAEILVFNIAAFGGMGLSELLKRTFHRIRPPLPWLTSATGYSFPSGHALISLAVYGFLTYLILRSLRRGWLRGLFAAILFVLPLLVGLSRIYLGVHYPSDVLAGWAVAAFWIGTCATGMELWNSKLSRKHGVVEEE